MNIGTLFAELVLDKDKWDKALSGSERDLARFVKSSLSTMADWALKIGAAGAAAFTAISVHGAKFEHTMKRIATVAGGGFERLQRQARDMGMTTAFSADEAAEAMMRLAQEGMNAEQIMATIGPAANLAAGTASGLADSVVLLDNAMDSFGLSADKAASLSDIFATVINRTGATTQSLADGLQQLGNVAKNAGWSVAETAQVIGLMADAGIKDSQAVMALKQALSEIMSGGEKTAEALAKLGLSLADVDPRAHSFAEIMKTLHASGMTAKDALVLFGDRAGNAIKDMADKMAQGKVALTDLSSAAGVAAADAKKNTDDVETAFKQLLGTGQESMKTLYETWKTDLLQALKDAKKELEGLVKFIRDHAAEITKFAGDIGGVVGAGWRIAKVGAGFLADKLGGSLGGAASIARAGAGALATFAEGGGDPMEATADDFDAVAEDIEEKAKETSAKVKNVVADVAVDAKTKADTVDQAYTDMLDDLEEYMGEKVREIGARSDEAIHKEREKFRQFARGIADDLTSNLANAMAGMEVSWGSMVQGMKSNFFNDVIKSSFGGGTGTYGGLSQLVGGSAASWIGPIGAAFSLFKSIGSDKVRSDATAEVAQAQAAVAQAREQLTAIIAQANMGSLNLDEGTLSSLLAMQFSDPTLVERRDDRGGVAGLFGGENVYRDFANEDAIKAQLEAFEGLMEKVEGTERFRQAAGQNAFTGAGTHVINNLTFNAGVLVADDRAKDTLAREMIDRMRKLGLVT